MTAYCLLVAGLAFDGVPSHAEVPAASAAAGFAGLAAAGSADNTGASRGNRPERAAAALVCLSGDDRPPTPSESEAAPATSAAAAGFRRAADCNSPCGDLTASHHPSPRGRGPPSLA